MVFKKVLNINLPLLVLWLSICVPAICDSSGHDKKCASFTYEQGRGERGPSEWGSLGPDCAACVYGRLQSPIDLPYRGVEVSPHLGKLKTYYKPACATVHNGGHSIMVEWKRGAGKVRINGRNYKLEQCHWHTPSEHTFNGSRHKMELHLVHKSSDDETAVIGIVYKYGSPDPFLSGLIHYIKKIQKQGEEREAGMVNPAEVVRKIGNGKYYRYVGSLTTPPCTEGVLWTVMEKVMTVSRAQVKTLQDAVEEGFQNNARPVQESKWKANPAIQSSCHSDLKELHFTSLSKWQSPLSNVIVLFFNKNMLTRMKYNTMV